MANVCVGGAYDGMVIQGFEDELSCTQNEGHIEDRQAGGCSSEAIVSPTSIRNFAAASAGPVSELVLLPLRLVRDMLRGSPLIEPLERINDDLLAEITRAAKADDTLSGELFSTVLAISYFAGAILSSALGEKDTGGAVYTKTLHNRVQALARQLKSGISDNRLTSAIDASLATSKELVGKSATDVYKAFTGSMTANMASMTAVVEAIFPMSPVPRNLPNIFSVGARPGFGLGYIRELARARREISNKAASLGGLPGVAIGDLDDVPSGFVQRYAGCDIYYSSSTGAHEVHGDIRAKYNALGGAGGVLGLPSTDETGTPDGVGRYNHFVGGSIYWTPHTGPMMVRGSIRNLWASQGWEASPLGYPVADEYQMHYWYPPFTPETYWSFFENGAIFSSVDGTAIAGAAELSPDVLRCLIRDRFDQGFHSKDVNIGLEAQVDTLGVSGWHYGFWHSGPRMITYRLHGFRDNGVLPDTTFDMDVRVVFDVSWAPTFAEPISKSIIVGLDWISVTAHGLGSQAVADGVKNGVWDTFYPKEPADPWLGIPYGWQEVTSIPTGVDPHSHDINAIGILLTQAGGLQVLLNPVPSIAGGFRKEIAQNQMNAFAEAARC
jgi:hypothetical protein